MKNILLFTVTSILILAFYLFYTNESEVVVANQVETQGLIENDISSSDSTMVDVDKVNSTGQILINEFDEIDFQTSPRKFVGRCGFEENSYWDISSEKAKKEYNELSEKQLEAYEYLKAEEMCTAWYDYISAADEAEIEMLKSLADENSIAMNEFDSLTSEGQAALAKDVLQNKSMGLKKRFAIYHLLKYDGNFIRQVSEEVGTDNILYISQSALQVMELFECQNTANSCTVNSGRMVTECFINEEYCGLDYYGYLEKTRSQNEVNDFYNILDAVRRILDI